MKRTPAHESQQSMFRWFDFLQFDPPRRVIAEITCLNCGQSIPVEEFRDHRDRHTREVQQ